MQLTRARQQPVVLEKIIYDEREWTEAKAGSKKIGDHVEHRGIGAH
jgi:hypothetical protein